MNRLGSVSDKRFHACCVPVQVPQGAGSSEGGFWVLFAPGFLVGLWEGAEGGGEQLSCLHRARPAVLLTRAACRGDLSAAG